MNRECPKCGKMIPEEAAFCLYCNAVLDEASQEKEIPVKKKTKKPVTPKKQINKKKFFSRIGIVATFLLIMGICIFAMKNMNSEAPLKTTEGTTIIKETSTVAVTDNSGEAVTDDAGEQVFEVVEVTKIATVTTTQKQGILDKIFNNKSDSKSNSASQTSGTDSATSSLETTKQGFFDKLFGNDKTTEQESQGLSTTLASPESSSTSGASAPSTTTTLTTESTLTTTTTTTNAAQQTTEAATAAPATPITDFEYTISGKYASITKYTGNATHVTIPAVIDSHYVTEIAAKAFDNNNTVEIISFADDSSRPYLWVRASCFYSCANLKTINMPDTDLGIINNFARYCYNVEKITLKNNQYRYENGGLYYSGSKGWVLRYYCPAYTGTTLTLPDWSTGIEGACNLGETKYLKNIYMHKNAQHLPDQSILPSTLENIYIDDDNPYAYDINGIAFKDFETHVASYYPPQNKTTEFKFPENSILYGQYFSNPYLEVLYIPKSTTVHLPSNIVNGSCFKNLKTVYIEDGHPNQSTLVKDARVDNIIIY